MPQNFAASERVAVVIQEADSCPLFVFSPETSLLCPEPTTFTCIQGVKNILLLCDNIVWWSASNNIAFYQRSDTSGIYS